MATNFQINISTDILTPLETTTIVNSFQAGDKNGHSIRVKLYSGSECLTVISGSVTGYFQTEYNDTPFSANGAITSDNVVVVDIPASAYAEEGSVVAIVRLSDGSNTTTIAKIAFNVVEDVEQSGTTPTGTAWTVAQIDSYLDRLEEYVDTFQTKLNSVDTTIGEIKGTVGQMFDLTDTTFTTVDSDGVARTGYKYVSDNGKIKSTCYLSNGRSFIKFGNRPNLPPGKYTLSARVTYDSTLTGRSLLVGIGIGSGSDLYGTEDNEFYVDYTPKTSRGGSTDVTTETVGYICVTQELISSSAFGFMIIGKNSNVLTTNKPIVIDQIQLEYGPVMSAYSASIGSPTAVDVFARRDIVSIEDNLTENFNSVYHRDSTDIESFARFASLFKSHVIMRGATDASGNPSSVATPTETDAYTTDSYIGSQDCDSFLFFTDPHTLSGDMMYTVNNEYMAQLQKAFNSTPTSFVVCGGDWFDSGETPDTAAFKLGYSASACASMIGDCRIVIGCNDTNYLGKKASTTTEKSTRMSPQAISNLVYGGWNAYYRFFGKNTSFYVIDTGIEAQELTWMRGYGNDQVQWFAETLLRENKPHIVLFGHMFYSKLSTTTISNIAKSVLDVAVAYNARQSEYTFNGVTYNFSEATGTVELFMCGHCHADYNTTYNGIPVVSTIDLGSGSYPERASFDLVQIDYTKRIVNCVRVGSGEDRTVSLA